MAYQNNYNGGSYRGNGSNGRNGNGNNGGYNNSNGQQKKSFQHATFEIRGGICKTREGGLFTNSRSGKMVFFNLMVGNRKNTGNVDQQGNPIYEEVREFYRVCVSGQVMNDITSSVNVPYTSITVKGNIINVKTQDGRSEMMLFGREFNIEKVPNGNGGQKNVTNNGNYSRKNVTNNGGYNQNNATNGYNNRSYVPQQQQVNQNGQGQAPQQPVYDYENRPQNRQDFAPQPQNDQGFDEGDIPF